MGKDSFLFPPYIYTITFRYYVPVTNIAIGINTYIRVQVRLVPIIALAYPVAAPGFFSR